MKKLLISVMVLVIAMSAMVCVSASELTDTLGQNASKEIDVTAKYSASVSTPEVYSVDISWDSMTFSYTQKDTKNWNADNHSYNTVTEGGWDKTASTVKVTNHSNASVEVSVEYTAVEDTGISGTLSDASAVLSAGEEGNFDGADSVTATLTISGKPTSRVSSEGVKVGSVKVIIK